jgi:hypothetical protein
VLVPSFLTPSCPSRCDDPGDDSRVAFRFRREGDGIAGDEGGLKQYEGTRRAGIRSGSCFFRRLCVSEFRRLTRAACEGSGLRDRRDDGWRGYGVREGGETRGRSNGGSGSHGKIGVGSRRGGSGIGSVLTLLLTDQGRTELEGDGNGESDEDEDAGVLVLQAIGAMGSSFDASVRCRPNEVVAFGTLEPQRSETRSS